MLLPFRVSPTAPLLCGLALLAGCGLQPPSTPPVSAAAAPTYTTTAGPTRSYAIVPQASTLHILVYRGGPMARLGHNHVVSSSSLHGTVWQGATLADAGFDITVPVNDLVVDDNMARAAEGEDFAAAVGEDAKQGTKANMLRDTLLDGARYPEIRITSVRVRGDASAPEVTATLRIKEQARQVTVPVTLQTVGPRLQVQGRFDIKQSDFGITPLSIALGALQVVDAVTIKFVLVAVAD